MENESQGNITIVLNSEGAVISIDHENDGRGVTPEAQSAAMTVAQYRLFTIGAQLAFCRYDPVTGRCR